MRREKIRTLHRRIGTTPVKTRMIVVYGECGTITVDGEIMEEIPTGGADNMILRLNGARYDDPRFPVFTAGHGVVHAGSPETPEEWDRRAVKVHAEQREIGV